MCLSVQTMAPSTTLPSSRLSATALVSGPRHATSKKKSPVSDTPVSTQILSLEMPRLAWECFGFPAMPFTPRLLAGLGIWKPGLRVWLPENDSVK